MKSLRKGLFETNSSSTHSISIGPVEEPESPKIPRNSKDVFKVPEYEVANGHTDATVINTIVSEVWKLSFLLDIVATHIWKEYDEGDYHGDYIATTFSMLCSC